MEALTRSDEKIECYSRKIRRKNGKLLRKTDEKMENFSRKADDVMENFLQVTSTVGNQNFG